MKYIKYEACTTDTSLQPCCGSIDGTAACLINTVADRYRSIQLGQQVASVDNIIVHVEDSLLGGLSA
jgi:hypothetical protein